ncbi:MAG TPA: hypothetical protein VK092_06250, partial [Deinococcales bacterium]|nr:hypothetical protein [Deinococcales bacterium]
MININLLPRELRRVREPVYWKVLSVALPLLALAAVFAFQYTADVTARNLRDENARLQNRVLELQEPLQIQRELQQRQAQLRELIAVANEVRDGAVSWTSEISGLVEHLPGTVIAGRPGIDFSSLQMQSVYPGRAEPALYEGRTVFAETSVSGTVANTEILEHFVRALEQSDTHGVDFQSTSLESQG